MKLLKAGFDRDTVNLIMDAWRPGTKKVYTTYLRKWATFCVQHRIKLLTPTLGEVCKFLTSLSKAGLGYGAINAARSALATILPAVDGHSLGKHPLICLLVKGAYERNPPAPRYDRFWDVGKVFDLFKKWGRSSELDLKHLTLKLTLLLLLVSSQRGQTILCLRLEDLEMDEVVTFRMRSLLKHNRLGDRLDTLTFKPFDQCYRLCVVRTLKEYVKRTEKLRKGEAQLLVSFVPPHRSISRDTLARWVLTVLRLAGIDTGKYKSHSTRGASASASKRLGVGVNLILKRAGWKSVNSFAQFYDKDIEQDTAEVGQALLNANV